MDTLRPFFFLSHPTTPPVHLDSFPDADYYKNGPNDILFVIGGAIIFAFLREATMKVSSAFMVRWFRLARDKNGHIITPPKLVPPVNGGHMNGNGDGLRPRKNSTDLDVKVDTEAERTLRRAQRKELKVLEKNVTRFGEQAWSVLYYTVFFSLGMYIYRSFPHYPFNLSKLWEGYPHVAQPGLVKRYYLLQLSFWADQLVILNIEARRKDHFQMLSHHVITISLMVFSYMTNFTRIGSLILVLMDFCDIFLSLAKMLKYLQLDTLCDATFVFFLISWLVTRQVLYFRVAWSVTFEGPALTPFLWDPDNGRYWTKTTWILYSAALWGLGIILCVWFAAICNVAYKVIRGAPAEDIRSDDEEVDTPPSSPSSPSTSPVRESSPAPISLSQRKAQ